ncbi:hypothetical protein MSU25_001644 [Salmonella enterica]|nr:hypothetical protein [Salmonella enterica]EBS4785569.1 hypothetical protein [Salmonella enterica subsp. enterica serovar Oranienburg]EBS5015402.1 hypothetical protein [Salmonella enterica subsp. enterica serovar Oranienburg]EBS5635424.1 hypothetical protein [Salmonella enterica subsp. enterica serovar Oranienburg]EBV0573531.1 hypothetical protein [Salmonella enterica subsp. enterica serovar Oranienburg]
MEESVNWSLIIAALKKNGMKVKEISRASHLPRSVINALAHGYVGLYPDYSGLLLGLYRELPVRSGE